MHMKIGSLKFILILECQASQQSTLFKHAVASDDFHYAERKEEYIMASVGVKRVRVRGRAPQLDMLVEDVITRPHGMQPCFNSYADG